MFCFFFFWLQHNNKDDDDDHDDAAAHTSYDVNVSVAAFIVFASFGAPFSVFILFEALGAFTIKTGRIVIIALLSIFYFAITAAKAHPIDKRVVFHALACLVIAKRCVFTLLNTSYIPLTTFYTQRKKKRYEMN